MNVITRNLRTSRGRATYNMQTAKGTSFTPTHLQLYAIINYIKKTIVLTHLSLLSLRWKENHLDS